MTTKRIISGIICLLFISGLSKGQDLSGTWVGELKTKASTVHYELMISGSANNYTAYALTSLTLDGAENTGLKTVALSWKKNVLQLEDLKLLFNTYSTKPKRMKLFASLHYERTGNRALLAGTFTTRSLDYRSPETFSGTIFLEKKPADYPSKILARLATINSDPAVVQTKQPPDELKSQPMLPPKKPTVKNQPKTTVPVTTIEKKPDTMSLRPAAAVAQRKTEVIQSLHIESDSLVLSLYDNGEIDGDTVSIVFNGQVIISKKQLSQKPERFVLHLQPEMSDTMNLIMYAENLGRIPPNTGLLVIEDGAQKTSIRFSSDLKKNAAVRLVHRKKKPA